jgi:hypothetical protein
MDEGLVTTVLNVGLGRNRVVVLLVRDTVAGILLSDDSLDLLEADVKRLHADLTCIVTVARGEAVTAVAATLVERLDHVTILCVDPLLKRGGSGSVLVSHDVSPWFVWAVVPPSYIEYGTRQEQMQVLCAIS